MFVKIGRMHGRVTEISVEDDSTISNILKIADISVNSNEVITLDGEKVYDHSVIIDDGEVLLIIPDATPKTFNDEPKHIQWAMLLYNISHAPDLRAAERICEKYRDMFRNI